MRPHNDDLLEVIEGGVFAAHREAYLYYGNHRVFDGPIPIVSSSLRWNGDSQIQGGGTCTVVWQSEFAEPISPKQIDDPLAPFGATLAIYDVLRVGAAEWKIPLGWFRIVDVPSARDQRLLFQGRVLTVGSVVELTLQDRMIGVKLDTILIPEVARSLESVYEELIRLTGLQITRSVADAPITARVVYEKDRLDGGYQLAKILDAIPYMTSDGTLSLRPKAWPEPVATLIYGPGGSVADVGSSMSSAGVYNKIVVRSTAEGVDLPPYVTEVQSGPLRTRDSDGSRSPAGTMPYELTSPYITTVQQQQQWGDRELPRLAALAAKEVPVVLGYNPLYEVGDVLRIIDGRDGGVMLCRITAILLDDPGPDMEIMVEVASG